MLAPQSLGFLSSLSTLLKNRSQIQLASVDLRDVVAWRLLVDCSNFLPASCWNPTDPPNLQPFADVLGYYKHRDDLTGSARVSAVEDFSQEAASVCNSVGQLRKWEGEVRKKLTEFRDEVDSAHLSVGQQVSYFENYQRVKTMYENFSCQAELKGLETIRQRVEDIHRLEDMLRDLLFSAYACQM